MGLVATTVLRVEVGRRLVLASLALRLMMRLLPAIALITPPGDRVAEWLAQGQETETLKTEWS